MESMVSISDFEQVIGTTFTVQAGGVPVPLELTTVSVIASSPRPGSGFSLLFKGPRDAVLPQAMYHFAENGIVQDIFIVPISADAASVVYEAVFN
jgi:hypothetical protein